MCICRRSLGACGRPALERKRKAGFCGRGNIALRGLRKMVGRELKKQDISNGLICPTDCQWRRNSSLCLPNSAPENRYGFIVVWCNKWEFRATGFDRISHNLILCIVGGWCDEDSNL